MLTYFSKEPGNIYIKIYTKVLTLTTSEKSKRRNVGRDNFTFFCKFHFLQSAPL